MGKEDNLEGQEKRKGQGETQQDGIHRPWWSAEWMKKDRGQLFCISKLGAWVNVINEERKENVYGKESGTQVTDFPDSLCRERHTESSQERAKC